MDNVHDYDASGFCRHVRCYTQAGTGSERLPCPSSWRASEAAEREEVERRALRNVQELLTSVRGGV